LVTVTKSDPKKTRVIPARTKQKTNQKTHTQRKWERNEERGRVVPSIAKIDLARGEFMAERGLGKSALPTSITGLPG
jgi:hypothetical protein